MNLVLIGYRGTGKSTIGRILAAELRMPLVSLDAEIVSRAGLSIPEIVKRHSWDWFRDREEEVVRDFAARDGQVLDTGGGVILRPVNVERLKAGGILFLLESTVHDIVHRIGSDTQRPSLTGARTFTDEVTEVLAIRQPLYQKAADHTIDTSAIGPLESARRIVETFRTAGERKR
jgi:shikimate kinase